MINQMRICWDDTFLWPWKACFSLCWSRAPQLVAESLVPCFLAIFSYALLVALLIHFLVSNIILGFILCTLPIHFACVSYKSMRAYVLVVGLVKLECKAKFNSPWLSRYHLSPAP